MCGKYILEWLDSLITVSLNPVKTDCATVTDDQIKTILIKMAEEKTKFQSLLKNHVFRLTKEKQVELLIKQYHSALVILLDQALENSKAIAGKKKALKRLAKETITAWTNCCLLLKPDFIIIYAWVNVYRSLIFRLQKKS